MPSVSLDPATIDRLDDLRIDDERYDETITEQVDLYETTELTLAFGGDEYV